MPQKMILTNGREVKIYDPWNDETPGVWTPDSAQSQAKSVRLVPSVFAGIAARSQAMADLPFSIYGKGDKVVDDSDDYKNAVGVLPDPFRFLWLAEAALVSEGKSYWLKAQGENSGKIRALKYFAPESINPKIDAKNGLTEFVRTAGAQTPYKPEDILYLWLPDPAVELGPPIGYPLKSAMDAAEASGAITRWVRDYMQRGAIKAMLLAVEGMPQNDEKERIESWFNRFMAGARGLRWRIFNASSVKPTIVGDGLEALKGITVNSDLRYEIHTALGTRHLLEDENFATANARERQFYTITVLPDARLIQEGLNEQVLKSLGYSLHFEPERLEVFQEDEADRASSLSELYNVFSGTMSNEAALQLSMDILGYQLSEEQKALVAKGVADKQAAKPVVPDKPVTTPSQDFAAANGMPPDQSAQTVRALVELDKWEAKIEKAGKMVTWHAVDLDPALVKQVKAGKLTFEAARHKVKNKSVVEGLTDSIEKAVAVLEAG